MWNFSFFIAVVAARPKVARVAVSRYIMVNVMAYKWLRRLLAGNNLAVEPNGKKYAKKEKGRKLHRCCCISFYEWFVTLDRCIQ